MILHWPDLGSEEYMYIHRHLEHAIQEASQHFRVILLTGPRQVGKTTLLQNIDPIQRSYVTLDDINYRIAAEQDPVTFIQRLKLPVLIDEAQYAPALFSSIKMIVDQTKTPGLFWLTGSQQFDMMKTISDSLAGRVAIFKLQGISLAEEQHRKRHSPFLPDRMTLKVRQDSAKPLPLLEVYHKIWRGSYPTMILSNGQQWERFYESYVSTYLGRDVKDYLQVNNPATFYKFMQIAASRTGQLINYSDMSRDVNVSEPTLKSWLHVLQASGIIYLLPAYFNNQTKRLIKTPKLYFMDTGLCCFLTGWLTSDVLERGAMAGPILETYVISEIIKSYLNHGRTPRLYFYRDKDAHEIDLLIEENGLLYPIEIKKTGSIQNISLKSFDVLTRLNAPVAEGGILCFVSSLIPLSKTIEAIPIGYI